MGVCLHPLQSETVGINGSVVDNGAATTNGGSAVLQVTSAGTTTTVSVYYSTDNFGSSDVLLASFAAATTVGAQRITIASGTTVNRYLRIEVTSQTGTFAYSVSFHRN